MVQDNPVGVGDRRGRDLMVVGFTTTYAMDKDINTEHQLKRGVQ
jgi:hypothetical protein